MHTRRWSGGQFNINMPTYRYRKSHRGDKTIFRPSYLHNGISYTGKMTSLYWIGACNLFIYHTPLLVMCVIETLLWRHNECDGISNCWRRNCLLKCLFRHRSKKILKLRVTGLCEGNSSPVKSPYTRPVSRKILPFDDVIMKLSSNSNSKIVYLTSTSTIIQQIWQETQYYRVIQVQSGDWS